MPDNPTPGNHGANSYDVAVLGGGSFGTAMAKVLGENGHVVHFWMRDEAQAEEIRISINKPSLRHSKPGVAINHPKSGRARYPS